MLLRGASSGVALPVLSRLVNAAAWLPPARLLTQEGTVYSSSSQGQTGPHGNRAAVRGVFTDRYEKESGCTWGCAHAHVTFTTRCKQTEAQVLAGGAEVMFELAERSHKCGIQGKYCPRFCRAEMAFLQHLSKLLVNGPSDPLRLVAAAAGAVSGHNSPACSRQRALLAPGAKQPGASPVGAVWEGCAAPGAAAECTVTTRERRWLVPVLASKEIQAGYEQKGGVWACFAGGNSSRSAAEEDHFSVATDLVLFGTCNPEVKGSAARY